MHAAGWQVVRTGSYGYVETAGAQYMLTLVDRGADTRRLPEPSARRLPSHTRKKRATEFALGSSSATSPTQA